MTNAAVTNTFAAGATAVASQVNQNFTDILTFLNVTGVPKVQAAVVDATALASASVTAPKIGLPAVGGIANTRALTATLAAVVANGVAALTKTNTSFVDLDASLGKVIAKATGLYLVSMVVDAIGFSGTLSAATQLEAQLWANGSLLSNAPTSRGYAQASGTVSVEQTFITPLTANDFVQIAARLTTVGSGSPNCLTTLSMVYLGPSS